MNFLEKNALYIKLKNSEAIEADKSLLTKRNPKAPCLAKKYFDKVQQSNEILNALIEVAAEDEIINNRLNFKVAGTVATAKKIENAGPEQKKKPISKRKQLGKGKRK